MDRGASETSPWLVVGAAIYWASYAFRISNATPVYATALGDGAAVLEDVFMTAWVVASYLACRWMGLRRARVVVSSAMIAAAAVVLACDVALPSLGLGASVALMCLDFFTLGASMILWGMAFASLSRQLAARNVVTAVLVAAAAILGGMVASVAVPVSWITEACTIACSAIMLSGRVILRNHARPAQRRPPRTVTALLAQRLLYGFALGFFPAAAGALLVRAFSPLIMAYVLALLVACVAVLSHDSSMLPTHVLIACCALVAPFLTRGMPAMLPALFVNVWLCWQTLSSVQLSDLKERFGISELTISLIDKAAIAVTILLGAATCRLIDLACGTPSPDAILALLVVTAVTLAVMSAASTSRLVEERREDDIRSLVTRATEERDRRLYEQLAEEFGLSAREREVVEMLARGYSANFIAKRLGVTPGTAKAHVAHNYQKLGVHHKDEMLELVDGRAARQ